MTFKCLTCHVELEYESAMQLHQEWHRRNTVSRKCE